MGRGRIAVDIEDQVVADYASGMAGEEIAARHGIAHGSIYNILERRGVNRRPAGQTFRGGRTMRDGYVLINVAHAGDIAQAMTSGATDRHEGRNGRYVLEHRLVMAESLGRALSPFETVHHINGDRSDNRIENLQLRIGQHGKHAAFVCADCGSHNLVPTKLL